MLSTKGWRGEKKFVKSVSKWNLKFVKDVMLETVLVQREKEY